jgi:hypothetical protein
MKIPKVVNILGHDYKVIWTDQSKLEPAHGRCEYPTRVIRLSKDIKSSKELAWLYFLHEIHHGRQFENGDMQFLDPQTIEAHADAFASMVVSLQKQGIL